MSLEPSSIWHLEGPAIQSLPEESTAPVSESLPPTGSAMVVRLNGAAMAEEYDVFEQFSKAFKFPVYFGWNWDAMYDCLRDLSWCPAGRYLTVIENADSMLESQQEVRDLLLSTLARVSARWAISHDKPNGVGIPFKVLLFN